MNLTEIDWKSLGLRIGLLRSRKGLSIRKVADIAQVDKNTYLRLERGLPVRQESLEKVCRALGTTLGRQKLDLPGPQDAYAVSIAAERKWETDPDLMSLHSPTDLDDEARRLQLGWSGKCLGFNGFLACELFGGTIVSSIVELFGRCTLRSFRGQELIYCLRGSVVLSVGKDEVYLNTGDAVCLWAEESHTARPKHTVQEGRKPPAILSVRVEGSVPEHYLKRQR
ncbi:MAG: helix-turn-helix domain-containing protein [Armatimonadetes bacterium]|nr:helix-turn-helix domain-containing protein [Armatimonadota bacterium]MBS1726218.1 helix-turn-helix domain-containing protein [Armatimonadota bacterium]